MLGAKLRGGSFGTDGDAIIYDWATYTDDAQPAEFSRIWGTEDIWRVRQPVSELDADPTTNTGSALTIGNYTDVDITGVVRADTQRISSTGTTHNGVVVRATGPSRNGYIAALYGSSGEVHRFQLFKYTAGGFAQIGTQLFGWLVGSDYNIRLQAIGTTIKAKIWADGDTEPAGWNFSITDTDHSSGAVGAAYYWAADYSWGNLTVEDLS